MGVKSRSVQNRATQTADTISRKILPEHPLVSRTPLQKILSIFTPGAGGGDGLDLNSGTGPQGRVAGLETNSFPNPSNQIVQPL